MNQIDFKKNVLAGAKARQQELIDDFRRRIEEMRKSEMAVHEDEHDAEDRSYNASTSELVDSLATELNFLVEEMEFLDRMIIESEPHQAVTVGSIVKTNRLTFFPSVSIEKFKTDGKELFGISTKAPLFKAMNGKKVGETFSLSGEEYEVLELF